MTAGDGGRIHGWWNQFHRGIQQTGMATTHTIFLVMERRSKKNIDLRSQLKCGGVSGGVKGQDEREERALDPAAHASEVVRLDNSQRRHTQNDSTQEIFILIGGPKGHPHSGQALGHPICGGEFASQEPASRPDSYLPGLRNETGGTRSAVVGLHPKALARLIGENWRAVQ